MFDDGSPKTSHRLIVAIGAGAAVLMFLASFGAQIGYRAGGRDIVISDGATLAQLCALVILALLVGWHRGMLGGIWPLIGSLIISAFVLLYLAGDWLTGWQGSGGEATVTARFYVTFVASLIVTLSSAIGLRVPVVEQSGSSGGWQSHQADDS